MSYPIVAQTPSVADCRRLREISGLSPRGLEAAERGLPNTLFGVTVFDGDVAIGMGRVVGDGGSVYQIVDIAVDPAYQGKGLGKAIMGALMDFLHETAPPSAYVSLIADGDAKYLYEKFGFAPVAPKSIGMALVIGEQKP